MTDPKKRRIFQIGIKKWSVLEEIGKTLRVPYDATVAVQNHDFTLSDFYGEWIKMHFLLKKLVPAAGTSKTNLASKLLDELEARKVKLIDNPAMVACIYLDPRFKHRLAANEITLAKNVISDMWIRVKCDRQNEEPVVHEEEPPLDTTNDIDMDDEFEKFLGADDDIGLDEPMTATRVGEHMNTVPDFSKSRSQFVDALTKYGNLTRIDHRNPILQYWETIKELHPEVHFMANIFHGIPPTQATVERSFSALAFIYNSKRYQLSQAMLESILIVKLNSCLIEAIYNEEILKIKTNFQENPSDDELE